MRISDDTLYVLAVGALVTLVILVASSVLGDGPDVVTAVAAGVGSVVGVVLARRL